MNINIEPMQSNPKREDMMFLIVSSILNDVEANAFHHYKTCGNAQLQQKQTMFYAKIRDISESLRIFETDTDDSAIEKIIKNQSYLKLTNHLSELSDILFEVTGENIILNVTSSSHDNYLSKQFNHNHMKINFT